MSVLADPAYIVHNLRLSNLRLDDRTSDKVITFPPNLLANEYIKTAGPVFPEMQYCYSPNISHDYLMLGAGSESALTSNDSSAILGGGGGSGGAGDGVGPTGRARLPFGGGHRGKYDRRRVIAAQAAATAAAAGLGRGGIEGAPPGMFPLQPAPMPAVRVPLAVANASLESDDDIDDEEDELIKSPHRTFDKASVAPQVGSQPPGIYITTPSRPGSASAGADGAGKQGPQPRQQQQQQQQQAEQANMTENETEPGDITIDSINSPIDLSPPEQFPPHQLFGFPPTQESRLTNSSGTEQSSAAARNGIYHSSMGGSTLPPAAMDVVMSSLQQQQQQRGYTSLTNRNDNAPLLEGFNPHAAVAPPPPPAPFAAAPPRPKPVSLLTRQLKEQMTRDENPFAEEFLWVAGMGEMSPVQLKIYLPSSDKPLDPMQVVVKRDATVEDVIGYILYQYYSEGRRPPLNEEQSTVVRWTLRIVEDDGEIDDDFPAVERTLKIGRFSMNQRFAMNQFALCEATPAQVQINENLYAKSGRTLARPKRPPMVGQMSSTNITADTQTSSEAAGAAGVAGGQAVTDHRDFAQGEAATSALATGAPSGVSQIGSNLQRGGGVGGGVPGGAVVGAAVGGIGGGGAAGAAAASASGAVVLPAAVATGAPLAAAPTPARDPLTPATQHYVRVRLMTNHEVTHTTTVEILPKMVVSEIIDYICLKRKMNPAEWSLIVADSQQILPLNGAAEDISSATELVLIPKSSEATLVQGKRLKEQRQPSNQPLKVLGDQPQNNTSSFLGSGDVYREYTVNRKRRGGYVGRHEQVLAIDGDYVRIMPLSTRTVLFDSGKTASYLNTAIYDCRQSRKAPSHFKLTVIRGDREKKTYEFEADSTQQARKWILFVVVVTVLGWE
ncbi:hypothetical protein BGZ73_006242 [Actinomortierella ambigua]|nr:hypothetical protein BGZ73_006242 [Actinomortierella ambigua]